MGNMIGTHSSLKKKKKKRLVRIGKFEMTLLFIPFIMEHWSGVSALRFKILYEFECE